MKKTLLFALVSLLFLACKREELVDVIDPGQKMVYQTNNFSVEIDTANLDVYNFSEFDNPGDSKAGGAGGDVQILNADTTLVSVTKSYLGKIKDNPRVGEKLILYLNDTTVLNKRIDAIQEEANRYILSVSFIPMEEVFTNLAMNASADEYYDPSKATKSADNPNNWQAFLDSDGVLHPAKSIFRDENGELVVIDHANQAQSKWGPSLKLGFDLTFRAPINVKRDNFVFGIEPKVRAWGGVGFELKINWFRLKKFEVYAGGGIDVDFPIKVSFKGEKKIPIYDKSFTEDTQYKTFWVGAVPVIFNYKTGVKSTANITFNGKAEVSTGFKYTASHKVGHRWENGKWTNLSEHSSKFDWTKPNFTMEASTSLSVFVGPYFEFGFYGAYMGEAYVGGYAEIMAKAAITIAVGAQKTRSISANVEVGLKAGVAAKLKILRWELGKWGLDWKMISLNLFKGTWSAPFQLAPAPFASHAEPIASDEPEVPTLQPFPIPA